MKPNEQFFLDLYLKGRFEVFKDSSILNTHTGHTSTPKLCGKRARKLSAFDYSTKKYVIIAVNRFMWIVFNGPIPENHFIMPKDGNMHNCALDNLEYLPKIAALRRMRDFQAKRQSEERNRHHGGTKLTDHAVADIRRKYRTGNYTMAKLAEFYKISVNAVSNAVRGNLWRFVEEPPVPLKRFELSNNPKTLYLFNRLIDREVRPEEIPLMMRRLGCRVPVMKTTQLAIKEAERRNLELEQRRIDNYENRGKLDVGCPTTGTGNGKL